MTFQVRYSIKCPRWGNRGMGEDPDQIVAWNERPARHTENRRDIVEAAKATLIWTHKRHSQHATIKIYMAYQRVNSFGPWEPVPDKEVTRANMALAREARNSK